MKKVLILPNKFSKLNSTPKIAVVCNHNYIDFQELFNEKSKIKSKILNNNIFFLTNYFIKNKQDYFKIPSSFCKKPFFDKFFFIDLILAQFLLIYLFFKDVKYIHFTTSHSSNLFYIFLAKIFNIKLIFSIHRFDLESYDKLRRFFLKIYNKFVIFFSYKIIILSDTSLVPASKKELITLSGFNLNLFDSKKIGKYFLFFGRIDDYKGLDILYYTAKELSSLNFVVAGNGKSDFIDKLKSLNNVKILNRFIEENEVKDLFFNAKACILPYKNATQSGVQILSYSYATPVIVNDVGNLKEFVKDRETGLLVRKNEKLKDKILEFENMNLYPISSNCIDYFKENFSNFVLRRQYKNFYESLIK